MKKLLLMTQPLTVCSSLPSHFIHVSIEFFHPLPAPHFLIYMAAGRWGG